MEAVRVKFKNGVFVPVEDKEIPEGAEGIVVFSSQREQSSKPHWWEKLRMDEGKKHALHRFSQAVFSRITVRDIKVVLQEGDFEVFVLVTEETDTLRPIMEVALEVYEQTGVYIPVQVISSRRLERWKEQGSGVFNSINEGVSIK